MKKRLVLSVGLCLFLAVVLWGCGPAPLEQHHGDTYFTQVGMWVNGNRTNTANYSQGIFIPVNTRVEIIKSNAELIVFKVPDRNNMQVQLINETNYSGEDIKGLFQRRFGEDQVNLDRFSRSVQQNIRNGSVEPGMSKKAVILARGFPPAHGTASLDSDTWKYWNSSFNTILVHFSDNRVSNIET